MININTYLKSGNMKFIIRDTWDIKEVSGEVGTKSLGSVVWTGIEALFKTFSFLGAFGTVIAALELASATPRLGSK